MGAVRAVEHDADHHVAWATLASNTEIVVGYSNLGIMLVA
jgi:hypothetical protein